MSNNKIGFEPVKRRNVSIEDIDWKELNDLSNTLKLSGGVSSLMRAFLRLYKKNGSVIEPMMLKVIGENDRIQPENKSQLIRKSKFDIKDIVIGATNED